MKKSFRVIMNIDVKFPKKGKETVDQFLKDVIKDLFEDPYSGIEIKGLEVDIKVRDIKIR